MLPGQPHLIDLIDLIICSSLGGAAVLGTTEDIVEEALPDLPCHTLDLLDRLLQVPCNLRCHTLEVNVVALCHVRHRRGRVDVRAVGGGSVDGRLHDLLDQSKALNLSSGQKYRLISLSSSSLGR